MPFPNIAPKVANFFKPAVPLPPLTPTNRSKLLQDVLSQPTPQVLSPAEGAVDALNMGAKAFLEKRSLQNEQLDKQKKAQMVADALFGGADSVTGNVMDPRRD